MAKRIRQQTSNLSIAGSSPAPPALLQQMQRSQFWASQTRDSEKIMLPEKILKAREEIKAKVTKTHGWYVEPNHIDNFKMVASREILKHLMNIVVTMENKELHWNDWWLEGFKNDRAGIGNYPDHNGLLTLANEIAEEIYNEVSSVSPSIKSWNGMEKMENGRS